MTHNAFIRLLIAFLVAGVVLGESACGYALEYSDITIYAGAATSNFGGDSDIGVAIGVVGLRSPVGDRMHLQFGAEFQERVNSGTIRRSSSGDGTLLFEGEGEISLNVVQLTTQLQYPTQMKNVQVSPYLGSGLSLLLSQSVDTTEDSGDTFSDFDWYGTYDIVVLAGLDLQFGRGVLAFQVSRGLTDMSSDKERLVGSWPGVPFTSSDDRCTTYRVAAGVEF